jgi:beta-glucosidase/6-phospho-beta-glucosidase/beta-galactosidase
MIKLLGMAVLVLAVAAAFDFPKDFAWGVATAAYQIEGAWNADGKGPGIWDDFCRKPGTIRNNHNGEVADDFYHHYKEDIALMKSLGFKHFRMSFSWPRLLPKGTVDQPNPKGVEFYHNVLDELAKHGIEPWVTLFHWDLPSDLQDETETGAWLGRQIIDQFNDYADFCFKTFGDKVKRWNTLNEPWTFTWLGYGVGSNAPGRCSDYMNPNC